MMNSLKFFISLAMILMAATLNAVSVPGSLSGDLSVNNKGQAVYTIPIELPPGIMGMTPELALQYNSQSGDGILGVGWRIAGLSEITRTRPTLFHDQMIDAVDFDDNDRLLLDGQRLMLVSGSSYAGSTAEYRTEINEFSKITAGGSLNSSSSKFTVRTKGGLIKEYGHTGDSFVNAEGIFPNVALKWMLSSVVDKAGNEITYDYYEQSSYGLSNAVIKSIDYADYTVEFVYENRNDIRPYYMAGAEVSLLKRLKSINVKHDNTTVREYHFTYGYSGVTGLSLLLSVQQKIGLDSMPATVFSWPNRNDGLFPTVPGTWLRQTTFSVPKDEMDIAYAYGNNYGINGGVRFADLNADGLPDMLFARQGENDRAYLNTSFSWLENILYRPPSNRDFTVNLDQTGPADRDGGLRVVDVNGDNLPDLLYGYNGVKEAYINNGYTFVADSSYKPPLDFIYDYYSSSGIRLSLTARSIKGLPTGAEFVDLNGDGLMDMVFGGRNFGSFNEILAAYLNNTGGAVDDNSSAKWIDTLSYKPLQPIIRDLYSGPGNDGGVRFIDVNGDGLADHLYAREGQPRTVHLNTGSGWAGSPSSDYVLPHDFVVYPFNDGDGQDSGMRLVDLNADGLLDIVYAQETNSSNKATYLNTGAGWEESSDYELPSGVFITFGYNINEDFDAGLRFTDLNGDGLTDFIFSRVHPTNFNSVERGAYINTGSGWQSHSNYRPPNFVDEAVIADAVGTKFGIDGGVRLMDLDGDGLEDMIMSRINPRDNDHESMGWINTAPKPDLITAITNGHQSQMVIEYKNPGIPSDLIYTKGTGAAHPIYDIVPSDYVVSHVIKDNGTTGLHYDSYYTYGEARTHIQGLGFLGFQNFDSFDAEKEIQVQDVLSQEFPYIGLLSQRTIKFDPSIGQDQTIREISNEFDIVESNGETVFPYVDIETIKEYEFNQSNPYQTLVTDYDYDDYGNADRIEIDYGGGYVQVTTSHFDNYSADWSIGLLDWQETEHQQTGIPSRTVRREYDYYSSTRFLHKDRLMQESSPTLKELEKIYGRDSNGNVTSVTISGRDLETRSITYSGYSDFGNKYPKYEDNDLGHQVTTTYDERFGHVAIITDPNGLETERQYDTFGRLKKIISPDETTTDISYVFSPTGAPSGTAYAIITDPEDGSESISYFDRLQREIRAEREDWNGNAIIEDTEYNDLGQIYRISQKTTNLNPTDWMVYEYDDFERNDKITLANGLVTDFTYNGFALTEVTGGQTTIKTRNPKGQISQIRDNILNTTKFFYEPHGDYIRRVEAPGGVVYEMEYDIQGNRTALDDPDMGEWSYTFDGMGLMRTQTDAKAQTTTITYDTLNRLKTREVGGETSIWHYDGAADYNKKGLLRLVEGPNDFRKSFYYDDLSRTYLELCQIDGKFYYNYSKYDDHSRLTQIDYFWRPKSLEEPGNELHHGWRSYGLRYAYNTRGFTTTISDSSGHTWFQNPQYDMLDRVKQYTLGNGVFVQKTYDPETYELTDIDASGPGGVLQDWHFQYTQHGNLQYRQDFDAGLREDFTYDGLNRLYTSTVQNLGQLTYTYHADGNINTREIRTDTGVQSSTYSYGTVAVRPHAVTSAFGVTYGYDANGNLTSRGGATVTWKAFNKPHTINDPSGNSSVFTYGADHQRLTQEIINGATSKKKVYVDALEHTYEGDDIKSKVYVYGPIGTLGTMTYDSASSSVTRHYFHYDHLKSVIGVSDDSGQWAEQYGFDPWGLRRDYTDWNGAPSATATVTDRGYTGHEMLDNLGLVHMNGRIYDPQIARFLSPDPVIAAPYDLQNYNHYSYVRNNPMSLNDPSGYIAETVWDVGNIALGVFETGANIYTGDYTGAAISAGGVVIDVGAALIPFVPGGAGTGAKAVNMTRKLANTAEAAADISVVSLKATRSKMGIPEDLSFAEAVQFMKAKRAQKQADTFEAVDSVPLKQIDEAVPDSAPKIKTDQPANGVDDDYLAALRSRSDANAVTGKNAIDMNNAPAKSDLTSLGFKRNGRWFFRQLRKQNPEMFSAGNINRIKKGQAPVVDDVWIKHNPQHADFAGDKLIHHHIDQGRFAGALPEGFHQGEFSKLHNRTTD
ncbi:FG-GAP-like repeat-containing protein [Cerasicoccus frondis]|uniref:FG-GAP-like repeat-containing protein n=1 Tax=Cerasicoccus frondis TaxID=490090 RepID=UPI0028525097|nr:RHS repeat-associated core domain-containing protein [Cerasicoccus frondis]